MAALPQQTPKLAAQTQAYKEIDNALRAALNIAENILGKDADQTSKTQLAAAAITIAFSPHATLEMREAFLRPS